VRSGLTNRNGGVEWRCAVVASECKRSYLFVLTHEFGLYGAYAADKSDRILDHPCGVPSAR